MTRYTNTSPYSRTTIIDDKYLDILLPQSIPASSDDVLYTIEPQYSRRPDLLAFDLYQSPKLWWVFAQRNFDILKDPVFDFKAGTEIIICEPKTLYTYLGL